MNTPKSPAMNTHRAVWDGDSPGYRHRDVNIRHLRGSVVKSAAKSIAHRLKQARSAVLRIEAAWVGAQFLLALGTIGVLVGVVLQARRRRTRGGSPREDTVTAPAADAEAAEPAPTTSTNPAANGLVN
jgi:hypothetical protein